MNIVRAAAAAINCAFTYTGFWMGLMFSTSGGSTVADAD
jgi:hypothetical protein